VVPLGQHFHAIAMDMAGHGFTVQHPGPLSRVDALADHLLRFMDTLGIERAHLVGESLGGSVGARVALDHPDRVGKLVYVTGAGLEMGEEADRLSAPGRESFQRLTAAAQGDPTPESIRNRLAWLFLDPDASITDELVALRLRIYKRRKVVDANAPSGAGTGALGLSLTPEKLREIKVPFFFLWTDHNPSTPWQVAEMAHKQMPGSKFHIIKGAGHWPQYEQTEEFNRVVTEFLTS
jgi:2-hydroxy-6-oxonona-2,4-dienedioate hydrolase/2-hydroxy-6-oxo-6-(2'-carboxyphenyl)-hexa-2,4-dienoate hydrolase